MKKISILALTGVIFGCSTANNTAVTKVPLSFQGAIYNSVASQYIDRPTFAEILHKDNGKSWINIDVKKYGTDQYGIDSISNTFLQHECPTYIAHIEKYLEWEEQASKDGDIVQKKIGSAKTILFSMDFEFYSGNANNHYLAIGMSGGNMQFYDRQDAIALKDLLTKFQNNEIKPVNIEEKYQ